MVYIELWLANEKISLSYAPSASQVISQHRAGHQSYTSFFVILDFESPWLITWRHPKWPQRSRKHLAVFQVHVLNLNGCRGAQSFVNILNSPAIGICDDNGSDGGGLLIPALYRYLTSAEWWLEHIIPLWQIDKWPVSAAAAWWPGALGPVNLTAIGASGGGGPSRRPLWYFLVPWN